MKVRQFPWALLEGPNAGRLCWRCTLSRAKSDTAYPQSTSGSEANDVEIEPEIKSRTSQDTSTQPEPASSTDNIPETIEFTGQSSWNEINTKVVPPRTFRKHAAAEEEPNVRGVKGITRESFSFRKHISAKEAWTSGFKSLYEQDGDGNRKTVVRRIVLGGADSQEKFRPGKENIAEQKGSSLPLAPLAELTKALDAFEQNPEIGIQDTSATKIKYASSRPISRPRGKQGYLRRPWLPQSSAPSSARQFSTSTLRFARPLNTRWGDSSSDPMIYGGIREHLKTWRQEQQASNAGNMISGNFLGFHDESLNAKDSARGFLVDTSAQADEESLADDDVYDDSDPDQITSPGEAGDTAGIYSPDWMGSPGDLVTFGSRSRKLGIIVSMVGGFAVVFSELGTWHMRTLQALACPFPNFVSQKHVRDLSRHIPEEFNIYNTQALDIEGLRSIPRSISGKVLQQIRIFRAGVDEVHRGNVDRLSRPHRAITEGAPCDAQLSLHINEVSQRLLATDIGNHSAPTSVFAVSEAVNRDHLVRSPFNKYQLKPYHQFLRAETLEELDQVREWVRDYRERVMVPMGSIAEIVDERETSRNPVSAFLNKARRMIVECRRLRQRCPNGHLGPLVNPQDANVAGKVARESFTLEELKIISLFREWTCGLLVHHFIYNDVGSTILKATGMYEDRPKDAACGMIMLQELGQLPRTGISKYTTDLDVPGRDPRSTLSIAHRKAQASLETFQLQDSMATFRKDWGNLAVYCIDSKSAMEIDDGLSWEPTEDDKSLGWIHVHVANPSAFLNPDSAVGSFARELTRSMYFPHQHHSMLPHELTSNYFSLGRNRPCITFSARISRSGDMLEHNITHGVVHDVVHLEPEKLLAICNDSDEAPPAGDEITLQVGPHGYAPDASSSPATFSGRDIVQSDIKVLKQLNEIAEMRYQMRLQKLSAVMCDYGSPSASPTVCSPSERLQNQSGPRLPDLEDPIISLRRNSRVQRTSVVTQCMLLAGEICAEWSAKRNLPILYRGIRRYAGAPIPPEEFYQRFVEPLADPSTSYAAEVVHKKTRFAWMRLLGHLQLSRTPCEHPMLDLHAYCQATSPLRRFGDLAIHWQVEAALRHEQRTACSLEGQSANTYQHQCILPFADHEMDDIGRELVLKEQEIMLQENRINVYWTAVAMHQAHYFQKGALPETFDVRIRAMTPHYGIASSPVYGPRIRMVQDPDRPGFGDPQQGDVWEVRLDNIDLYSATTWVHPVRLVERVSIPPPPPELNELFHGRPPPRRSAQGAAVTASS